MAADLGGEGLLPGVTPWDTAEVMVGSVLVTPVLFESDGSDDPSTEDWENDEIDAVLAKITEGVQWWSDTLDTLGTVHELDFVVDDALAYDPIPTGIEPISRPSDDFRIYVRQFLTDAGYGDAGSIEAATLAFNHDRRLAAGTDWAVTLYVVDSSDDEDGLFDFGGDFRGAFAYPEGGFYVVPSERPTSTFTHELGHLFWALDEYPGGGTYNDSRGYYDTVNENAWDNPNVGFVQQPSIMANGSLLNDAYDTNTSPASTLAMIGWQDSDGDGVFDAWDVPLELSIDGTYDPATGALSIDGLASATALTNRNPTGIASDITFGKVDALQFSLGGGNWLDLVDADGDASFDIDYDTTLGTNYQALAIRAIDRLTGVTSEPVVWNAVDNRFDTPGYVRGVTEASFSLLPGGDTVLPDVSLRWVDPDGNVPEASVVDAGQLDVGLVSESEAAGWDVSFDSLLWLPEVFVENTSVGNVFAAEDSFGGDVRFEVDHETRLIAEADLPIGGYRRVDVGGVSVRDGSRLRVSAFDRFGELIERRTSDAADLGEDINLTIETDGGLIARVEVTAQGSEVVDGAIAVRSIAGSHLPEIRSDDAGGFRFGPLPGEGYRLLALADNPIYDFGDPAKIDSLTPRTILVAQRVNSPLYNDTLPDGDSAADVDRNEVVQAIDALAVLNELRRSGGSRSVLREESGAAVDVSNDGIVSPLDALLVLNELRRRSTGGEGEADGGAAPPAGGDIRATPPVGAVRDAAPPAGRRPLAEIEPSAVDAWAWNFGRDDPSNRRLHPPLGRLGSDS